MYGLHKHLKEILKHWSHSKLSLKKLRIGDRSWQVAEASVNCKDYPVCLKLLYVSLVRHCWLVSTVSTVLIRPRIIALILSRCSERKEGFPSAYLTEVRVTLSKVMTGPLWRHMIIFGAFKHFNIHLSYSKRLQLPNQTLTLHSALGSSWKLLFRV